NLPAVTSDHHAFAQAQASSMERISKLLAVHGNKSVIEFHRDLGRLLWDHVGMSRNREGLEAAITDIAALRDEFWHNVLIPGQANTMNKYLEFAGRVADFMELGELMARDALKREESCGGHFREEFQTAEGEALRNDNEFAYVAGWKYSGDNKTPEEVREELTFENVTPSTRSYK
ncbi:MAG TPA: fumarate reductase/succinate dehydrogenase flavoprotein subunit, partial [Rhodothermia bacterium]|nr:fumarate reductase/succinate dehydrogenase flavoprotein subunit [Rhodothermia bacterium]